jgi:hypothetical protein
MGSENTSKCRVSAAEVFMLAEKAKVYTKRRSWTIFGHCPRILMGRVI